MKKIILIIIAVCAYACADAETLIAYYSYTNNVHTIVTELQKQIDADIVRIEPVEKGLDYAANNYAIGSAQISAIRNAPDDAESYPEIDPVDIDFDRYDTFIIAAPLWWSNMAAPLQSFLFKYGKEMARKHIGLIVSSASSGISGVEADARRLIPEGEFLTPSLWIRSSQTHNAASLLESWLKAIDYGSIGTDMGFIGMDEVSDRYTVYTLSGELLLDNAESVAGLTRGIYIINGKKTVVYCGD